MLEPEKMTVDDSPEDIDVPIDKIQGIVRCVFCTNEPTRSAEEVVACKLLECCHTVCGPCIDAWDEGTKKTCPTCRLELNKSFLEHKILQEMVILPALPASENTTCDMHNSPCEHYCVECGDYVCDVCIESHKQLKVTQNHTIKQRNQCLPSTKEDKPFGKFPCPKHQIEQMAIYCITCNRLTCRDCQLGDHKDHNFQFVKDVVQDNKCVLFKMFLQTRYSWMVMEAAVNILEDRKMDLHEQKVKIRNEIAELGNRLHKAVDTGMSRLNRNLDTQCGKMTAQMDRLVHTLHQNMAPFEHTANFIEVILQKSTDTSVVYSQKFVRKHVEAITAKQVLKVPNPTNAEKIEFNQSTPNITQIIEGLEKIGTIQINKVAPVAAFAQIQQACMNPNTENSAFNSTEEGDKLFAQMVKKATKAKNGEEDSAQPQNAQAQIHVATNLMESDTRQAQIHVATNLIATDARPVAQSDPKQTSWHTPQPPTAGITETSTEEVYSEVLQYINNSPLEQVLQAVQDVGGGPEDFNVAEPSVSTVSSEPVPSSLQTVMADRNNSTMYNPLSNHVPVSTMATSYVQQSPSLLGFSPMNTSGNQSLQLASSPSLMQQQQPLQSVSNPQLNQILPVNRVNLPSLPPYPTHNSIPNYSGFDPSLSQLLRVAGNPSTSNNLFSHIDNP